MQLANILPDSGSWRKNGLAGLADLFVIVGG